MLNRIAAVTVEELVNRIGEEIELIDRMLAREKAQVTMDALLFRKQYLEDTSQEIFKVARLIVKERDFIAAKEAEYETL